MFIGSSIYLLWCFVGKPCLAFTFPTSKSMITRQSVNVNVNVNAGVYVYVHTMKLRDSRNGRNTFIQYKNEFVLFSSKNNGSDKAVNSAQGGKDTVSNENEENANGNPAGNQEQEIGDDETAFADEEIENTVTVGRRKTYEFDSDSKQKKERDADVLLGDEEAYSTLSTATIADQETEITYERLSLPQEESDDQIDEMKKEEGDQVAWTVQRREEEMRIGLKDEIAIRYKEDEKEELFFDGPGADRAIAIVSELKANAALFAAFAFGSLNLPNTLTVSESKVTSVTSSLSISRPIPDSDLIQAFVILDVCTLCLMISCVAASQLLIYRLTDGSYEESEQRSNSNKKQNMSNASLRRQNSALGRLVTNYRVEFTVARASFDLGLVALLFAVAVRAIAIFDRDIAIPITVIIGITAFFLGILYVTSNVAVFQSLQKSPKDNAISSGGKILFQILGPLASLSLLGVALFDVNNLPESVALPRLGPYGITPGESKLRVVAENVDIERALKKDLDKKKEGTNKRKNASTDNRSNSAQSQSKEAKRKASSSKKSYEVTADKQLPTTSQKVGPERTKLAEKPVEEKFAPIENKGEIEIPEKTVGSKKED